MNVLYFKDIQNMHQEFIRLHGGKASHTIGYRNWGGGIWRIGFNGKLWAWTPKKVFWEK